MIVDAHTGKELLKELLFVWWWWSWGCWVVLQQMGVPVLAMTAR